MHRIVIAEIHVVTHGAQHLPCNDTGVKPTIGDLSTGDWVHTRGNESRHKINPILFRWFQWFRNLRNH
jgi:hypothetical protein